MIDIEKIENIDDKKHVALLDTSSISFMQGLKMKGMEEFRKAQAEVEQKKEKPMSQKMFKAV